MKKKYNKIIQFPNQVYNKEKDNGKNKIDWILIVTTVGVLVSIIALVTQVMLSKKSEVQYKPVIDIELKYFEDEYYGDICLDQNEQYINSLSIKTDNINTEPVIVTVIPFYNIIYYNQRQKTLIKQMLPIYDLKNILSQYTPLDIDNIHTKNDIIANIKLNENSYIIIHDLMTVFDNLDQIKYDDYFYNIFNDSIIASIDFEYYVVINYKDIYQNEYKEVYLCETGFRNFSGYLTDCIFAENENIDKDIIEYNVECLVKYAALKAHHLENMEFDAKLSKVSNKDVFYEALDKYYSEIYKTSDKIYYVTNICKDLNNLISCGYVEKQLVFILNEKNEKWNVYK